MNDEMLTQFSYNPETGNLHRKGRLCLPRSDGYIRISVDCKQYYAHRIIWLLMTGSWPKYTIDHINRNPSDNRWSNLRDVTHQVNLQNMSPRRGSSVPISGVCFDKENNRYRASMRIDGKLVRLKSGKDFFEVVCARKSAEAKFRRIP